MNVDPILPIGAFLLGIGGSLHCIGMCGGLVMASSQNFLGVTLYQVGRLLGYLLLALIASLIGHQLTQFGPWVALIGPLFLGGLFIYWGIQTWRERPMEIRTPELIRKFIGKLWAFSFKLKAKGLSRSFFTGALSLFLPCGLLYGVLFGLMILNRPDQLVLGMFIFWLGTLPAMLFAPQAINRLIRPLTQASPKFLSLIFIGLGLGTIVYRMRPLLFPLVGIDPGGETCH